MRISLSRNGPPHGAPFRAIGILVCVGCLAACNNDELPPRDIQLVSSTTADETALREISAAQYAVLETIAGRDTFDLGTRLTQNVRLVDLRTPRDTTRVVPRDVGFFEIVADGFEVPIGRRRESAGDSAVHHADDYIVLEWQHIGGDVSRVSWRRTEEGWKAAQIVLWSPPRHVGQGSSKS